MPGSVIVAIAADVTHRRYGLVFISTRVTRLFVFISAIECSDTNKWDASVLNCHLVVNYVCCLFSFNTSMCSSARCSGCQTQKSCHISANRKLFYLRTALLFQALCFSYLM